MGIKKFFFDLCLREIAGMKLKAIGPSVGVPATCHFRWKCRAYAGNFPASQLCPVNRK